jgi:hypothetical protein
VVLYAAAIIESLMSPVAKYDYKSKFESNDLVG